MIQEYALDPSVLVAQYSRQYGFLRDSFNDTGRILSQYPRKWQQKVMKELGAASEEDRMKLVELLSKWLLPHSVIREDSIFNGGDWLIEAENEDGRLPFYGILSNDNPRGHSRVIPFEDIVSGDHDLWLCAHTRRVMRTAEEIVAAVAPMLTRAKRIVLIDPYFLVEPRFYNVLAKIIEILTLQNCIHHIREVQVCTALKGRRGRAPEPLERESLASNFKKECMERMPRIVPLSFKINFTVYFEKEHGIDAHDRHILTNIAGVDFGQGLDQRQTEQDENQVRIHLLDSNECCRLEEDFQPHMSGTSASYHIESEFTVEGKAKCLTKAS